MVKAVTPIPFVKARFFDRCGKPLAGGKVYTYEANTTTPKVTYKDPYGLTPNTNPIILDAAGEADIYLDGTYRIRITDRNGVLVNDVEKIGAWFSGNLQDGLDNISLAMDDAIKPKLAAFDGLIADTKNNADVQLADLQTAINTAYQYGAGANGWTTDLVVENGLTQKQINNKQRAKNLDTVNVLDYMTANELSAYQADATTFNAAPVFNRASIDCYNKKRKLMAYGTFYTTETIVITSDCDLSQADIFTSASLGIDVKDAVDTASVKRLIGYNFVYPRSLKYTQKPAVGWVANTVGLRITNAYSCKAYFGRITGFETNILICAKDTGNVYNEYFMGWCDNGKVNLLLTANDTGWTNENNFYGGRFSHQSGEGTNVAGTRHIKIAATELVINNNVFYKPSIEADIAEYHVECGGSINSFLYARWEASPAKVLYVCNDASTVATNQGQKNLISGGYNTDAIVISKSGTKSSFLNRLIGQSRELNPISGTVGGHRYRNKYSSSGAVLTVFEAATDIDVADLSSYAVSLSSMQLQGKRATDDFPQINIDFANGKFLLGNGTVAPSWGIEKLGAYATWAGGEFMPKSTDTQNLGKTNYKWKQLYLSDGFGAWDATPPTAKPSVTGSRGDNAALASLITALASYGLITNNTTA